MRILFADDDNNFRRVLGRELREEGHSVGHAECGKIVLGLLEDSDYDVVLLDLKLPDADGLNILKRIKDAGIPVEVIILTGHGSISTAVDAMRLGAYDYLTKPFELEELCVVLEKAYEKKKLVKENAILKTQLEKRTAPCCLVIRSPLMLEVVERIKHFATTDFPVAILGESGVGKELVADAIHHSSKRAEGPFVRLNCGALPGDIIESELFGHEKGAFSGAHAKKLGLIEIANGGTLFLDEIGELPTCLQTRLLRVIDSRCFYRVGGTKEIEVDVRFVSATNKDIRSEIDYGRFREDLYYRLTALTLTIPPLRERSEEIPALIDHFLQSHPEFRNKSFNADALKILGEYSWPGNVRELKNVVCRTMLLASNNNVAPRDLPDDLVRKRNRPGKLLEEVERQHILKVLDEVNGRKQQAAKLLGVDPKTLYRKLLRFDDLQQKVGTI